MSEEEARGRPKKFTRRYGFGRYKCRWEKQGDGEVLRIRRQKTIHKFGQGHQPRGPEITIFDEGEKTAKEIHDLLGIMLGVREPYHVDNYGNELSDEPPGDATDIDHRIRKRVMDAVRDLEFEGVPPDRVARELRFVANEADARGYDILGSELDAE